MSKKVDMLIHPVKSTLVKLSLPMIFGMLGLIIFNLVDTYFVAKLGTQELAALSFTYPVVLILNSLALGIGMGTSTVVSRAAGRGSREEMKRLTSDALSLGVLFVLVFAIAGRLTIRPLFGLLGATGHVLDLIETYMSIWYVGTIFVVIPMVGNSAIRALGDTKTPSYVMITAALVNTLLDPLLIFGLGPFPRLEVAGAALATVLARATTFSVAIYVLAYRERLLSYRGVTLRDVLNSYGKILYIGIPNALSKMIQPIGVGIITGLLASYGPAVVAGYGVSAKIERFAVILIGALSTVMAPFVGQNYGAKKISRIASALAFAKQYAIGTSFIIAIFLWLARNPIIKFFSQDPEVIETASLYLMIVPIFYGFYGLIQILLSTLNALGKPIRGALLSLGQLFVVYIPLAYLLSQWLATQGIFLALGLSYLLVGLLGYWAVGKYVAKLK